MSAPVAGPTHDQAAGPGPVGPSLRREAVATARWAWRRLTSMRTALVLLALLAVAAIPGSLFPQRSVDPAAVAAFTEKYAGAAPWLDRLGFFTVYSSPWFAAVYLLLFTSLVGCIVPRLRAHVREWRSRPAPAPARLDRLAGHESWVTEGSPAEVAARAARMLRRSWSVAVDEHPDGRVEVAAEQGRLRETGNLVFHTSLIGVLIALATGSLYSWRGEVLVVEGSGFANTLPRYSSFTPGPRFDTTTLPPFSVTLDSLAVRFELADRAALAAPRDFRASVTITDEPGSAPREEVIRVNDPATVDGARVFLSGNGYAPVILVTSPSGEVLQDGPVPFLPQDGVYTSRGVVKVPDADGTTDLALSGVFLPTADDSAGGVPVSVFPDALNPQLLLTASTGDLGLDSGAPRSVFTLDGAELRQVRTDEGTPWRALLTPGTTADLPDGSTVTFVELRRFAALDVRSDPSGPFALGSSVLVILGLATSLFVARRRVWLRVTPLLDEHGAMRSVVEVAGRSRPRDVGLAAAVRRVRDGVHGVAAPDETVDRVLEERR